MAKASAKRQDRLSDLQSEGMTDEPSMHRRGAHGDRRRILTVLAVVIVLLPLDAFWIEPASLHLTAYGVPMPERLRPFGPLRVAVIADLHGGAPFIDSDKIDRVVELANGAKPDLILLTGDYVIQDVVGGHRMSIETIVAHLRPLSAPLGVFAVLGNHDRWEPNWPHIWAEFERVGIRVLEDKTVRLFRSGRTMNLTGIRDYATYEHDGSDALATIPRGEAALCFTHSPDVFPLLTIQCALTVAGHTHGGQVWLPILGRRIVPSRYGQRYAIGLISEGGKLLFVSSGIGTSIVPVRFMVPPAVSVLDIR